MQRILLLVAAACLALSSACSSKGFSDRSEKVVENYSKRAQLDHRLELQHFEFDYADGTMSGINHLTVEYYAYQLMEIDEARQAITETAEGLLQSINNDDELRPFILNYPMEVDNLTMRIEIEHFFGQYFEPVYIGYVVLEDGFISYYSYDKTLKRRESYDNAQRNIADMEAKAIEEATVL